MDTVISDKKEITVDSPEFQSLLDEVMSRTETLKQREQLSEESFRTWVCGVIKMVADRMGYVILNLIEIPLDLCYSFKEGFLEGAKRARENSYRNRNRQQKRK